MKSKSEKSNKQIPKNFDYEIGLLVMAKKTGLSFDELSMFTLDDFIKFVEMYVGDEEEKEATQQDIDAFYAM